MSRLDFSQFELLTFDCYGTLIDWERGILDALCPILSDHNVTMSDEGLLELYAQIESTIEQHDYQPYRDILRKLMRQLALELEFRLEEDELGCLAESISDWPPFGDTVEALGKLKERYKLGIISNIDDDLLEGSRRRLQVEFDFVITAQQAQAYKPSPRTFEFAFSQIGVDRQKVLHVAQSLYHDIAPANNLNVRSVWVNRRKGQAGPGATPPAEAQPDLEVASLAELAAMIA